MKAGKKVIMKITLSSRVLEIFEEKLSGWGGEKIAI